MKTIYYTFLSYEDDEAFGESDAFFEVNNGELKYITSWDCNDASWREEYMGRLLKYAGLTVERLPDKYQKKAVLAVKKAWGI